MRLASRWLLPGGLVLALTLGAWHLDGTGPVAVEEVTGAYAVVLYGVVLALAVAFHRSRVFVAVAMIALTDWSHRSFGLDGPEGGTLAALLGPALAVFLGIAALMRDRGITSPWGLAQVAMGAAFAALMVPLVRDPMLPATLPAPGAFPLPDIGAVAPVLLPFVAAAFVLSAYAAYRWRGPVERAILWSQIMVLVAAHPAVEPSEASLFLMAAALTLGLSVLETSYAMAYRDELTGLPGRRSLMRDLDGLNGTYTLAMVDVDHFKRFNDRHGHDVGDQVLRLVASRLARAPGGGKAYRYGGEEFTLLYRGRLRDDAVRHLEEVRKDVEAARFALRRWGRPREKPDAANGRAKGKGGKGKAGKAAAGKKKKGRGGAAAATKTARKLSVTVSVGMADSAGRDATTPESVLKKADQALYRAKRDGRNRVSR